MVNITYKILKNYTSSNFYDTKLENKLFVKLNIKY
jgi:hypothetical protein